MEKGFEITPDGVISFNGKKIGRIERTFANTVTNFRVSGITIEDKDGYIIESRNIASTRNEIEVAQ